jgi:hypothetical protein
LVVAACHRDLRVGTMRSLEARAPGAVVVDARIEDAHSHPFREELAAAGSWCEVTPHPANGSESRRHCVEDVLQRTPARPPEFIRIAVDHPVGSELSGSPPGKPCHPLPLLGLAPVTRQVDVSLPCIPLEDVGRAVVRAVVDRHDEIDARVEVEREVGVDDVGLVAGQQCHHDLHD